MGLMMDAAKWWWILMAHECQAIPLFARKLAELKVWHSTANLDQKSWHLWS
jgi:hypothetical protein